MKNACVAPAATVTLAGTLAVAPLLDSVTVAPPAGAPLDNVTVPCDADPPATLAGLSVTLCSAAAGGAGVGGVTVNVAVRVVPLYAAVIVIVVFAATAAVAIMNVAVKLFSAAVAVAGTLATFGLLLDNEMTAPPVCALVLSTTVPLEALPPTTVDGFVEKVDSVGSGGGAWATNERVADHAPATPATFPARTRQK